MLSWIRLMWLLFTSKLVKKLRWSPMMLSCSIWRMATMKMSVLRSSFQEIINTCSPIVSQMTTWSWSVKHLRSMLSISKTLIWDTMRSQIWEQECLETWSRAHTDYSTWTSWEIISRVMEHSTWPSHWKSAQVCRHWISTVTKSRLVVLWWSLSSSSHMINFLLSVLETIRLIMMESLESCPFWILLTTHSKNWTLIIQYTRPFASQSPFISARCSRTTWDFRNWVYRNTN